MKKRSKTIKIQEKCKKYAKKFAYIKKKQYLCTRFQKQTNQRWRQHHKNGNKIMTAIIEISYQFKGATTMYVGECKGDFCPVAKAYATIFHSIKAAKDYINANKVLFHGLDSKIVTA